MPSDERLITPQDLLPDAEFAKIRRERRAGSSISNMMVATSSEPFGISGL